MEGDGAGIVTEIMPTPKDQYIIDTLGPKVKESINPKYREYTDAEYPQTYLRYLIDCETGEEEYCNDLDSRVYERDNNLYINKISFIIEVQVF